MWVGHRGRNPPRRSAKQSLIFALASLVCLALLMLNGLERSPSDEPAVVVSNDGGASFAGNNGDGDDSNVVDPQHLQRARATAQAIAASMEKSSQPSSTSSSSSSATTTTTTSTTATTTTTKSTSMASSVSSGGKVGDVKRVDETSSESSHKAAPPSTAVQLPPLPKGGYYDFPIIMMTHKRAGYLKIALESLLAVRGVNPKRVYVFQDGEHDGVATVASSLGLRLLQRKHRSKHKVEAAVHIAGAYKWALSTFFADVEPLAESAVIVEEDQLFSPDFLAFFHQTAPVLRADPSILTVSSYNDNGFSYAVSDPGALRRTEFFIGLGWLLTRTLWQDELKPRWPRTHWDHWVRSSISRGRETVFPEVSRSFHFGIRGAHANVDMYRRYFENIELQVDHAYVDMSAAVEGITQAAYETRIRKLLARGRVDPEWTRMISAWPPPEAGHEPVAVLVFAWSGPTDMIWETHVSRVFGLWHSIPVRGMHKGLVELKWNGWHVMLVGHNSPYMATVRSETMEGALARATSGGLEGLSAIPVAPPAQRTAFMPVIGLCGESCDDACARRSLACSIRHFAEVNTCAAMDTAFGRRAGTCEAIKGFELPARECESSHGAAGARRLIWKRHGNEQPFYPTCGASHPTTKRLCPCAHTRTGTIPSVTYRGAGEAKGK